MYDRKIKYIRYQCNKGFDTAIMFPEVTQHVDVANSLKPNKIYGAGFCEFVKDDNDIVKINCYGESVSLKMHSAPEDGLFLTNLFIGHNYIM